MTKMKKTIVKAICLAGILAITLQSITFAKNIDFNKLNKSYPLKKDLLVFNQFKLKKEPMLPIGKNVNLIYHYKDGTQANLEDKLSYPIQNLNGRTSIAIKDITELFNLNINWNSKYRIVEVYSSNKVLRFPIDKSIASINNSVHPLDAPATISSENNRTYLPIRYLLTNLGYKVKFNSGDNSIHIYE